MRLKELRKENRITQKELAKTIGYEQTIISMWESGTREPSNETLIKLADFFNVSVDYLLNHEVEYKKKEDYESSYSIVLNFETEAQKELLVKVNSLEPLEMAKVDAFIDGLLISRRTKEEKAEEYRKLEFYKNNSEIKDNY